MLTLKKINKAVQKLYPEIQVVRTLDYFTVWSENEAISLKIAGLYQNSIHVYRVNQLTLEQWISHVKFVLDDNYRNELEREPVFPKSKRVDISGKFCYWDGSSLFLDEERTFPVSLDALTENQRNQLMEQL